MLSAPEPITLVSEDQAPKPPEPKPAAETAAAAVTAHATAAATGAEAVAAGTGADRIYAAGAASASARAAVPSNAIPSADYLTKIKAAVQAAHSFPRQPTACITPAG